MRRAFHLALKLQRSRTLPSSLLRRRKRCLKPTAERYSTTECVIVFTPVATSHTSGWALPATLGDTAGLGLMFSQRGAVHCFYLSANVWLRPLGVHRSKERQGRCRYQFSYTSRTGDCSEAWSSSPLLLRIQVVSSLIPCTWYLERGVK